MENQPAAETAETVVMGNRELSLIVNSLQEEVIAQRELIETLFARLNQG